MKKIENIADFNFKKPVVACLGVFDGLHSAHLKIINQTLEIANKNNYDSLFLTFKLPKKFKNSNSIYVDDIKFKLIDNNFSFDYYYEFNLVQNFNMSKLEFLMFLKNKLNIQKIVVGNNYHFGKERQGNIKDLQLFFGEKNIYDLKILKIDPNTKLSSTYIKNLLINNNFNEANNYLYKPFHCSGIVVKGQQIATTLGFPTANIILKDKLVIKEGSYIGKTMYKNKLYSSMVYYDKTKNKIESHIINKTINLYDKYIEVYFLEFLEKKDIIRNKNEAIEKLQRCYDKTIDYFKK